MARQPCGVSRFTWLALVAMFAFVAGVLSVDETRPVFVEVVAMLDAPDIKKGY